jgi:hypothetical protein
MNSKLLTFEVLDEGDILEIHMDPNGCEYLLHVLRSLMENGDHTHLMIPSWSGNELSEEQQNPESHLVAKVTLFLWDSRPK